jgi:hypothetical protein
MKIKHFLINFGSVLKSVSNTVTFIGIGTVNKGFLGDMQNASSGFAPLC